MMTIKFTFFFLIFNIITLFSNIGCMINGSKKTDLTTNRVVEAIIPSDANRNKLCRDFIQLLKVMFQKNFETFYSNGTPDEHDSLVS